MGFGYGLIYGMGERVGWGDWERKDGERRELRDLARCGSEQWKPSLDLDLGRSKWVVGQVSVLLHFPSHSPYLLPLRLTRLLPSVPLRPLLLLRVSKQVLLLHFLEQVLSRVRPFHLLLLLLLLLPLP